MQVLTKTRLRDLEQSCLGERAFLRRCIHIAFRCPALIEWVCNMALGLITMLGNPPGEVLGRGQPRSAHQTKCGGKGIGYVD